MEVILKQDMDNLGYADEIVKVRRGYARNYLIPRSLAIIANEESGKIYGSVNALQIADALSKHGVIVDRKKIHLDTEHIKSLGTYTAVVNLHKDVKAKVNFEVIAE